MLENFESIYDEYGDKIYRFVYYRVNQREIAEDLTSTVFMKALQNTERFDSSKGSVSSWLYRIARNTIIDYYRSRKVTEPLEAAENTSDDTDIVRDLETSRKVQEVRSYLSSLSEEQREVVKMRLWDDLPYKKIAEILDLNETNCRMIFSRAMKKIVEEFGTTILLLLFALLPRIHSIYTIFNQFHGK